MRNCDSCTKCCEGFVSGTVRGKWFGQLQNCAYLNTSCSIYSDRPSACRGYYCAWVQGLLPEELSPVNTNVVVSVEVDKDNKQFLKAIYNTGLSSEMVSALDEFTEINNTYWSSVKIIPIRNITHGNQF